MNSNNPVNNQPQAAAAPPPQQPVSIPAPVTPSIELYDLPKPKIKLSVILSSLVVILLIAAIPIGVYLTLQQQNIKSKADQVATTTPKTSLSLIVEPQASASAVVVKIYTRADIDPVNLIVASLKFPNDILEVSSIATSSAEIKTNEKRVEGKWLEAANNNQEGTIDLALGVPNPGFKSEISDNTKYLLATVTFNVKRFGTPQITIVSEKSMMLRNSDTLNILNEKRDLLVNLRPIEKVASATAAITETKPKKEASIKITSPLGGESFAYFNPIDIKWESQNIEKVSISLLLNDSLYGNLATNIANTGSFSWKIENTLPLTYINANSVFQIKVVGSTKDNFLVSDTTPGYFGLVSQTDAKVKNTPKITIERVQADLNNNNKVDFADLSLLLSNFNKQKFEESYDFNGDGVVNVIDLWLLRGALFTEKVIE